ncbi:hypothetical protein Ndes2526B_g09271 [Nannochloris sp. 'desiccata']
MFTAQFAEHILNKLAAHKRLVQVSLSALVVGDTFRSCYTISQLAKDRFKEIEQEEHAERVATTAALFRQVATRCQASDGTDFWPTAISQAAGVLPANSSTASASTPQQPPIKYNILEELLRPSTTTSTTAFEHIPTIEEFEHHHSIEDLSENQDYSQPTPAAASTTALATAAASSPAPPPVIYITWDDVWSHLLHTIQQTVQFVAATVEERSGESPLICAGREQQRWVVEVALDSVDTTREWCRGVMLWPQIEFQRLSALRYRVDWHGVTFPLCSSSKFSKKNQSHLQTVNLTHVS